MNKPAKIFLTGFMGSGKTTVGRILAERLSWEFIDLDQEIEKQEQRAVAEIFAAQSEKGFREIESSALERLIDSSSEDAPTVVALGGGTYIHERNREMLRKVRGETVYLEAENVEVLMERFPEGPVRPLAKDQERLKQLFLQRRAIYEMADLRVSTTDKSVEQIVTEIINRLDLSDIRRLR